ncbi:MAG: hypothetical protein R3E97_22670 [Candidatus Eisenbacteria bacterium]
MATLDDTQWQLQISAAAAELTRLRYEAEQDRATLALDLEADRRRFVGDVESSWLDCLETRAALAEAQVELQGLETKLTRSRTMAAGSLIAVATLEEDSTACQAQREVVNGQKALLDACEVRHQEAKSRLAEFTRTVGEPIESPLPATLAAAIQVQEIRLQIAEKLAATQCVLRSPASGVVTEVLRQPGEVVSAGSPSPCWWTAEQR